MADEPQPAGPPAEASEWRPDALARSRHSRLADEIRLPAGVDGAAGPAGVTDPEAAAALCAELCRNLLGDFAPALLLLAAAERRRVQTLLAYVHTLFDFARQRGVEGERLAQINRWEWSLELALAAPAAEPSAAVPGQPIFVAMAREQALRPWPEQALDELTAAARRRATRARPATAEEADAAAVRLARACAEGLLGEAPPPEVAAFAGALIRLVGLQNLGPETAAHRCPLPVSELADEPTGAAPEAARLLAAARRECERLRPRLLKAPRGLIELPASYRRAAVFSLLAGLRLLTRIEDGDEGLLAHPPRLGVLSRLGLLLRARWPR